MTLLQACMVQAWERMSVELATAVCYPTGRPQDASRLGQAAGALEADGHLVGLVGSHFDVPGLGAVSHSVQSRDFALEVMV